MRTNPLPPRWAIIHAVIALALAAAISSCGSVDKAMGHEPSPFKLFGRDDMRAGLKFAELEEAALKESPPPFNRYNCWDTLPRQKMRMCKITVDPGDIFALVDADKRVVRLLLITYEPARLEESYRGNSFRASIEAVNQMKASFDSIRPRRTIPGGEMAEYRWIDDAPRWSAAMWFRPREYYLKRTRNSAQEQELLRRQYRDSMALIPDSVAITDEKAYAELIALNPRPKPYVPDSAELAAAEVAPLPPTAGERLGNMRSDLERLARAQEEYFAAYSRFSRDLASLNFTTADNIVVEISGVTGKGWAARATHPYLGKAVCVVYGGEVANPPSAGQMGQPSAAGQAVCDPG